MTTLEVLKAARAKIVRPGTWCQEVYARDSSGRSCTPFGPNACQRCATGAIWAVVETDPSGDPVHLPDDAAKTEKALRVFLELKFEDVPDFNDDPMTKHEDVLQMFDRAIAAQEQAK